MSVAVLSLETKFRYYAVPALNPCAYLQCFTTNTSDYTLLTSTAVSIFHDNTFVSKSTIGTVCPGESFRCMLGVDPSIKVT